MSMVRKFAAVQTQNRIRQTAKDVVDKTLTCTLICTKRTLKEDSHKSSLFQFLEVEANRFFLSDYHHLK